MPVVNDADTDARVEPKPERDSYSRFQLNQARRGAGRREGSSDGSRDRLPKRSRTKVARGDRCAGWGLLAGVYPYRIMTSENVLENEIATRTQSDCGIRVLGHTA
jgi:hypothetical protein